ncbi:MAG: undecaprenyl-diphosphate phosphatase [Mailhella sp.]|nr:undecaprenyl-diphosphate phosphatase [Mailhella sp.]
METMLSAVIHGVVEGLTEFLPVSSSGHLVSTSSLLGLTGERSATFDVVIQVGAILAVAVLYWRKFLGMLFPSCSSSLKSGSSLSGLHGIWMLILTSLPASVLGLLLHSTIKSLFTPVSVALALFCGALLMLATEYYMSKHRGSGAEGASMDEITAKQALGIGVFQCLALWPGFSRSASTIIGGMFLGLSRKGAAEYSFVAAVPIICAAALYDMLKSFSLFTAADIPAFLVGSAVAFVSAVIAIRTFIALLARFDLKPFALYRILLVIPVYLFMVR